MKSNIQNSVRQRSRKLFSGFFMVMVVLYFSTNIVAQDNTTADMNSYTQYSGIVLDNQNNEPLIFATLSISGTNIATVCNSEGEFILKVPDKNLNNSILVSFLGYKSKEIKISDLKPNDNKIKLDMISVSLAEVSVFPNDPNYLIRAVLEKRTSNYMDSPLMMTSFYRETIKTGRKYASLSEAVVDVLKQPYDSYRPDFVKIQKARKTVDYDKLDTLVFKLMGGPYSSLMQDVMKDPYLVLTNDMFGNLEFSLNTITRINDKLAYVLVFKEKGNSDIPLYSGKLYIDVESLAVTSATYQLNVSNKQEAADMFIKKKPAGATVYPTEATYLVNYREKDGKWFFSYSRGQVNFKVNWKKKLFNTNYFATIEMATTNWKNTAEKTIKASERLKPNVIMENYASGFSDDNFWGAYNVIEPEKSIEIAIKKIQKNLDKMSE